MHNAAHSSGQRSSRLVCVGLAGLTVLGVMTARAVSRAQPVVRVRASADIELRVTGTSNTTVEGRLLDDLSAPLAERPLSVVVRAEYTARPVHRRSVITDAQGRFRISLTLSPGRYQLEAAFPGDDYHSPARMADDLDLQRTPVALRFEEPSEHALNLDQPSHEVVVRADASLSTAGLRVSIRDDGGQLLATGTTDASGRLRATVPSRALEPPGLGKLIARSAADEHRAAAQAAIPIIRFRPTNLTLRADEREGDALTLSGQLSDGRGPLAHKAVGVFDAKRHLATTLTDRRGKFSVRAAATGQELPTSLRLVARFDSDAPWIGSSVSPTVRITLQPDPPPHWAWLAAPSLASLLWLLLVLRLRRASSGASESDANTMGAGIHEAGTGRLLRATRRNVQGHVADAIAGRPIAGARVSLRRADGQSRATIALDDGSFLLNDVTDGSWALSVEAEGYAAITGSLVIPHRGQWSRMRVLLESLRAAAHRAYELPASAALGSAELAARSTPRETLDRAGRLGIPSATLARLTDRVEHAAYDKPPPREADLSAIQAEAEVALAEIQRAGNTGATHPSSETPKRRQ